MSQQQHLGDAREVEYGDAPVGSGKAGLAVESLNDQNLLHRILWNLEEIRRMVCEELRKDYPEYPGGSGAV